MFRTKYFLLCNVALIGLSGIAQAGNVVVMQTPNGGISDGSPADLSNMVTNDVLITTGPTESIGAIQIWAELNPGTGPIFNHSFGSGAMLTAPDPALVHAYPALEFDTFAASGFATNIRIPVITGASVDLGSPGTGGPAIFDIDTIDVRFGPEVGQSTTTSTNYLAARITLPKTAAGTFELEAEFSAPNPAVRLHGWVIHNGVISQAVPEPGSAALFGMAVIGLTMSGRRRRGR